MSIPADVIFVWTGTHAAIPAGWSREDDLDGLYPKGTANGIDPDVAGGNADHTHTSAGHDHTMQDHVHTINIAAATGGLGHEGSSSTTQVAVKNHDHANNDAGVPTNVSVGGVAVTYAAFSNDPPHYEVIFIKPDSPVSGLSNLIICFSDLDDDLGLSFCDGTNSTPDLRNKYLKGAAALDDAGGENGTYTNAHDIDHQHTQTHTHATAVSGNATVGAHEKSGSARISKAHTHSIALPANTTATGITAINLITEETVEPVYTKLVPIQNRTGGVMQPEGIIGMWLGTLANIPNGWSEVESMREQHLKCANTTAQVLDTGGSNTHTHAAQAHSHTNISHGHTFSSTLTHVGNIDDDDSGVNTDGAAATHAGATITNANYTLLSSTTTANLSDNEPEYRTVAFIKWADVSQGAFLLNFV